MRAEFISGYRKYREAAAVNLKAQLAWRADVVFNMLFTISKILFAYLLWGIIFRQRDAVAGFTFHEIGRASCRERVCQYV